MISIAICDDNTAVQAQIENYINTLFTDCPVEVFSSGEDLLSYLACEDAAFSIYFMDISMSGISGIETAAEIRKKDPYALIIYITDYKEYVYQVFETLPFRFISKPIDKEIFFRVLADAMNYFSDHNQMFHFQIQRKQFQIPFQKIIYLESRLRLITLHTGRTTYTFYGRLQEMLPSLNPLMFIRTHASYIINMDYILYLTDTNVVLQSNTLIPISKHYRDLVQNKHLEYLKWRTSQ